MAYPVTVSSGVIVSVSGAESTGSALVAPSPSVIVGGFLSGQHYIGDTSGALQVYMTNSVVTVTSGGTVNAIPAFQSGSSVVLSGGTAALSGQIVAIYGYQNGLVSGAGVINVQSGASVLHHIVLNGGLSGSQVEVHDSLSGNTGTIIATVTVQGNVPTTLAYDAYMKSGIVISTSGATVNATVTYKSPA